MKVTALSLFCATALMLSIFSACSSKNLHVQVENGLLIKNISVISPEKDSILTHTTVVIEGDSILYLGNDPVSVEGSYRTINGEGKFLIPGLIDAHVHISSVSGMVADQEDAKATLANAYREQLPKSYLYFGFTTLIDLIGNMERLQEFKHKPLAPDLYYAGPAIVANGYPMHYLPHPDRFEMFPNFLYLLSEASRIPAKYKVEEQSPQAVVDRIKKSGAIAVKTTYESGFDSPESLPVPTIALLEQLRDAAHQQGLLLVAHGNSLAAHQALTKVEVDVIVHGLWNWGEYYQADSLPLPIQELLNQQIEKKIGYMPTLQVIEGLKALFTPTFLGDPQLKHVLPAELISWYKTEEGQWFVKVTQGETPPEKMQDIFSKIAVHGQKALKYMVQHKGRILFGSDTPSGPTYGNPPGYNGYLEIQKMHQAGVSLKQILASATIENAKAFNLSHRYGTIQKGKIANLLILEKNPLEDVTAYDAIQTVILRGKPIERAALSANKQ